MNESGNKLLIVSPGIRPVENRPDDHRKRVVTVDQAFANGADHIIVGRPIRDDDNPREVAQSMQNRISEIFGA